METSIPDKHKDFFQNVFDVVRLIPKGCVTSYGTIAKYLGSPRSSRMVGWAMNAAHNYSDIPAHRVVNRIGVLTGKNHFSSSDEMQKLLQREGVSVNNDQVKCFDKIFWDPMVELEL